MLRSFPETLCMRAQPIGSIINIRSSNYSIVGYGNMVCGSVACAVRTPCWGCPPCAVTCLIVMVHERTGSYTNRNPQIRRKGLLEHPLPSLILNCDDHRLNFDISRFDSDLRTSSALSMGTLPQVGSCRDVDVEHGTKCLPF